MFVLHFKRAFRKCTITRRTSASEGPWKSRKSFRRVSANDRTRLQCDEKKSRVLKVVEIIRVYPIPPTNYDLEIRRRDGGHTRLRCRPRPPLARRQAIFTCVRVIFNEHVERPLRNAERRRQFLVLFLFLFVNSSFCPAAWLEHGSILPLLLPSRADITASSAFASSCSRSCVPLLPPGAYRNNPIRLR